MLAEAPRGFDETMKLRRQHVLFHFKCEKVVTTFRLCSYLRTTSLSRTKSSRFSIINAIDSLGELNLIVPVLSSSSDHLRPIHHGLQQHFEHMDPDLILIGSISDVVDKAAARSCV